MTLWRWINCAIVSGAVVFSASTHATVWNEAGDAGGLPKTAQVVVGAGALNQINGHVTGPNDVEMYLIRVVNPAAFSASATAGLTFGPPSLLLFDAQGFGVTGYDDSTNTGAAISAANVNAAGLYFLAYSASALPFDAKFNALWQDNPRDVERAPDGHGAANPIAFWGPTILPYALDEYTIALTGTRYVLPGDADGDGDIDDTDLGTAFSNYTGPLAPGTGGKTAADGDTDGDGDVDDADLGPSFAGYTGPLTPSSTVPEPGSLALLAVGGLSAARRRRR